MKKLTILVDFDGTVTTHEFPAIGKDIGAAPVLRELVSAGHQLILWTMRCDHTESPVTDDPDIHPVSGNYLSEAVKWFEDRNIPLYGINSNPTQASWTSSPKAYGTLCLDDINLGARLTHSKWARPFIDWEETYKDLVKSKILPCERKSILWDIRTERIKSLNALIEAN